MRENVRNLSCLKYLLQRLSMKTLVNEYGIRMFNDEPIPVKEEIHTLGSLESK